MPSRGAHDNEPWDRSFTCCVSFLVSLRSRLRNFFFNFQDSVEEEKKKLAKIFFLFSISISLKQRKQKPKRVEQSVGSRRQAEATTKAKTIDAHVTLIMNFSTHIEIR